MSKLTYPSVLKFLLSSGFEEVASRRAAAFIEASVRTGGLNTEVVAQSATSVNSYSAEVATGENETCLIEYHCESADGGFDKLSVRVHGPGVEYTVCVVQPELAGNTTDAVDAEVPAIDEVVTAEFIDVIEEPETTVEAAEEAPVAAEVVEEAVAEAAEVVEAEVVEEPKKAKKTKKQK